MQSASPIYESPVNPFYSQTYHFSSAAAINSPEPLQKFDNPTGDGVRPPHAPTTSRPSTAPHRFSLKTSARSIAMVQRVLHGMNGGEKHDGATLSKFVEDGIGLQQGILEEMREKSKEVDRLRRARAATSLDWSNRSDEMLDNMAVLEGVAMGLSKQANAQVAELRASQAEREKELIKIAAKAQRDAKILMERTAVQIETMRLATQTVVRDELARRKFEWEKTFGENFQQLQLEYDNAKIIWDSKLKNVERLGKQELGTVQRNAAAEKKKLEGTISHLQSRVRMLEDVINNPEDSGDAAASEPAAVEPHVTGSALAGPTAVAVEDESAGVTHDTSSLDGSPALSPSSSENAKLVLHLQEENQKLAEAKRSAQLRASILKLNSTRKPAVCCNAEAQVQPEASSADSQTDACTVYAWQADCRVPVLPSRNQATQKAQHLDIESPINSSINITSSAETRYISESELKQQILQQEREMMRRVKIRDSMRGAMESSSAMSVSMKIASLIEDTLKECNEMMSHITSKLLVLQDRQDDLFRNVDHVINAASQRGSFSMTRQHPPLPASAAKLARAAAKAKALWKSATEKQHFEEALSQAIEVTQNASPGNCRQGSSNLEILEVKRSQLKRQVQNELSLRDKALESHASIVESFYIAARDRLQHVPSTLLLRLPHFVINKAFERDAEAVVKASEQVHQLRQSPVAMLSLLSNIAPSFAEQEAVFVAICHASMKLDTDFKLHYLLMHFNKIKWIFDQFGTSMGSGLPAIMSKTKFIECIQRIDNSVAAENLESIHDKLADSGDMTFYNFCCAFMYSEAQEPIHEVQSVPVFNNDGKIFCPDGVSPSDADNQQLQESSHSQVSTPLLSDVQSLQEFISSPNRLRIKMKAVLTFFESAQHLHSFTSLKQRNALPPPPSPTLLDGGGRLGPEGKALSFSDFLQLAPDELRVSHPKPISSPVRLRTIVGLSQSDS